MARPLKQQVEQILKNRNNNEKLQKIRATKLMREAQQLRSWINRFIAIYYDNYSPAVYQRTYVFRNSLEMPEIVNEEAVIRFDSKMARHKSLFGGGYGYVPSLINYGWRWRRQPSKPIYRFTYYEGDHFLEDAIHAYMSTFNSSVTIEIRNGDDIKKVYKP